MIDRYSTPEMSQLFSTKARFHWMQIVEVAFAEIQGDMGLIPVSAAKNIKKNAGFNIDRILEIEKTTKHDVIAFVSSMAEHVGPDGRFIHFGLTSSDVLDTAFSLQLREGLEIILREISNLESC